MRRCACHIGSLTLYGDGWSTRSSGTNFIAGFHESNLGSVISSRPNVFGGSIGPAVVGAVSDRLSDEYGEEKGLRYALAGSAILCVLGQVAWFVASLSMRQDSENAKEEQLMILKEDYFAKTNPKRTQSQEESLALLGGKNV